MLTVEPSISRFYSGMVQEVGRRSGGSATGMVPVASMEE
jgi:hypothetical protein